MCVFLDFFFFKQLVFLLLCQFTKVKQTNLSDVSVINWIHSGSIPWLEQKANMFLKHNHGLCYLHLLTFRQQWLWGVPAIRLSNHYISTKTRGNSALLILWPRLWISELSLSIIIIIILYYNSSFNSIQIPLFVPKGQLKYNYITGQYNFFLPITHLMILAVMCGWLFVTDRCSCCVCFVCLWSLVYLCIGPTLENGKTLRALDNSNATSWSFFILLSLCRPWRSTAENSPLNYWKTPKKLRNTFLIRVTSAGTLVLHR